MSDENIDYSDVADMSSTEDWKKLYSKDNKGSVITDKTMLEALVRVLD